MAASQGGIPRVRRCARALPMFVRVRVGRPGTEKGGQSALLAGTRATRRSLPSSCWPLGVRYCANPFAQMTFNPAKALAAKNVGLLSLLVLGKISSHPPPNPALRFAAVASFFPPVFLTPHKIGRSHLLSAAPSSCAQNAAARQHLEVVPARHGRPKDQVGHCPPPPERGLHGKEQPVEPTRECQGESAWWCVLGSGGAISISPLFPLFFLGSTAAHSVSRHEPRGSHFPSLSQARALVFRLRWLT